MGRSQPCKKQGTASRKEGTACAQAQRSEELGLKKRREVWLMTFVLMKRRDNGPPSGSGWAGG